jgi:hypothetical protein
MVMVVVVIIHSFPQITTSLLAKYNDICLVFKTQRIKQSVLNVLNCITSTNPNNNISCIASETTKISRSSVCKEGIMFTINYTSNIQEETSSRTKRNERHSRAYFNK